MLLFRSERHVDRWCTQWRMGRGATMTLNQGWRLAKEWYADRLDLSWRPKTTAEAQATLTSIGLTGDFWKLTES